MKFVDKYWPWLFILVGCYAPTSLNGDPSTMLYQVGFMLSCVLLAVMVGKYGLSQKAAIGVWLVTGSLAAFTIIFGIRNMPLLGMGNLPVYAAAALMFTVNPPSTRKGLAIVSTINLIVGTLLVVGYEPVTNFFLAYYNDYYPELLPTMFELHKPVLTFASHSIAGLFLYLFFVANWQEFRAAGKYRYLGLAIGQVLLLFCVWSHTSIGFGVLALGQMLWTSVRRHPWKMAFASLLIVACVWQFTPKEYVDDVHDFTEAAKTFWLEQDQDSRSGFWGRFSTQGNMQAALAYVSQHPFSPVGLSGTSQMMLIDSGFVEDFIRGSLLLVLLMYGGLWYFLRRSLNFAIALQFFLCVLAFEVGFNILIYKRTLCLFPLLMAWMKPSYQNTTS